MDRILYKVSYNVAKQNWDNDMTPAPLLQAANSTLSTPGIALDLGCGTGTQAVELASLGWTVYGIDYVPKAIRVAKEKAYQNNMVSKTNFKLGDVSKLSKMQIPAIDFAYDLGCLHALNTKKQKNYVRGLADVLKPGALYLLFGLKFHNEFGFKFGLSCGQVIDLFRQYFNLESRREDFLWYKPGAWFWLRRKIA